MGKTEMDEFNEREVKVITKQANVAWEEEGEVQEAICAVCDNFFQASVDRPPIFCPSCKAGLKHLVAR